MTGSRRSGKRWVASPTDGGATAVEYALMAALVAGVIGVAVNALGQQVLALFQSVPIPFG
jgi:hypothetical protein